jgi:hypothetical protein
VSAPVRSRGLGVGLLLLFAAGCAEEAPSPLPEPGAPTLLVVEVAVVHHREEEAVTLPRRVEVAVGSGESGLPLERVLRIALEALVAGPTPTERERGIHSFFSDETSGIVGSVTIEDGVAVVDFLDFRALIPNAGSSAGSFMLLAELNGTVFGISGVEAVEYRLNGDCEAFWNFLQRACTVVPRPADA